MTHTQLQEKINTLGYNGMKDAYIRQCEDVAYYTTPNSQDNFFKNLIL